MSTEALAQYEAAIKARNEAFDDFVEAAEEGGLTEYDDEAPADYIETALEEAEAALAVSEAALAASRAGTIEAVEDAGGAAIAGANAFNNDDLNDIAALRASDARVNELAVAAQAEVRADTNRYTVDESTGTVTTFELQDNGTYSSDGGTTPASDAQVADFQTARQLQSQYNSAVSTLNGDVSRNGTTQAIAADLSAAIGAFLADNADQNNLQALQSAYTAEMAKDASARDFSASSTFGTAVDKAIEDSFGAAADTNDRSTIVRANADEDVSTAIVNGLLALNTRFANEESVVLREGIFEDTVSGADFLLAEELQDRREAEVEAVNNASDLADALESLKGEYDDAVDAVDAAAEALGYEVVTVDDGILFGEADTDELFIFNADNLDDLGITDVTVNDLEAGDALFFGTEYQLGGETGDNNALEFFVTTNIAGDVVVNAENTAFGSAQNDDYSVTLTGISEDQLSIDGGVISIVEVA